MSKTKQRLLLDALIAGFFIMLVAPGATGLTIHEWVGIIFIPLIITHILLDWKWIVNVTKRLLKKLPGEQRFNWVVNAASFVVMTTVIYSGVAISEQALPVLGIPVIGGDFLEEIHEASANLILPMVGVHVAMHWKWILNSINRYVLGAARLGAERASLAVLP